MLEPGRNCWRIVRAQRAALVVDAADYFRVARQAMLNATSQIMLIGWDFDTRIQLDHSEGDEGPTELGAFLTWLSKRRPRLNIYILKWDVGAIHLLGRGTTVLRIARWAARDNIHFRLDGAHAAGASHHQKIVVIDDAIAFCGGIDMTADRWDTRDHSDDDERRRRPTTRRRYPPWHDASMAVDGPAAKALGELARDRWKAAGGKPVSAPPPCENAWPRDLCETFREVDIAVSRTRGAFNGTRGVREIEALFVDQIKRAKKFVYAENQYFASRKVAEAIADRLAQPDCPEFVIVNPKSGQGWLDEEAMSPARARLFAQLKACPGGDRFRIYSPVTQGGEDIYVHSKIMIVDDELIRVGSANLNNRSMGLDSECDVTVDTQLQANRSAGALIARTRDDLLGEHLGKSPDEVRQAFEREGSLIRAIEALRGSGRTLCPLEPEQPTTVEMSIAENETLDPESSGEQFEPMARPGLLTRLRRRR